MRINVLFPTGTRTVDLDELKELARQGVVQPSTLLETGGQRGKAKNVPALKPIFDELAAAQTPTHTQTPQTSNPEPPAAPSETQDFVAVLRAVGQKNAPPQPLVDENAYSDAGTVEDEGLYAISLDDAPEPESQASPTPPPASATMQPPTSPIPSFGPSHANVSQESPQLKQSLKDLKQCERKIKKLKATQRGIIAPFLIAKTIVFVYMLSICFDPFFERFGVEADRHESYYGASISVIEAELISLYDFSYFNLVFCVATLATLSGLRVIASCALDRAVLDFQREKDRLTERCYSLQNSIPPYHY